MGRREGETCSTFDQVFLTPYASPLTDPSATFPPTLRQTHQSLLHLTLSGECFHVEPPTAQGPPVSGAGTLRQKD